MKSNQKGAFLILILISPVCFPYPSRAKKSPTRVIGIIEFNFFLALILFSSASKLGYGSDEGGEFCEFRLEMRFADHDFSSSRISKLSIGFVLIAVEAFKSTVT